MTAAAAVTFVLGVTLGLSQSFWAVIAAVVATQSSLGGTLKASFEQFIGSVFGAVWGGAITIVIPHQAPWMLGLALVIAVAPLAWLTTFSAGFRIAPITAILVLLSSMGVTMGPVDFAVERLLEIGLGCAVGLGVSVLVCRPTPMTPSCAWRGRWRACLPISSRCWRPFGSILRSM